MQVLKIAEVCKKTGISKATVYKLAATNSFPEPIKLGERASGWLESEVDSWIEQRVAERGAK